MAVVDMRSAHRKDVAESYESSAARRSNRKRGLRLTEAEIAELQDYWLGYAAEIGFRSVHGAVEARLLRSPPNKWTKKYVLRYLEKSGGRCPEAALMREVVESAKNTLEIGIQRYEANEAIKELVATGVLERERVDNRNEDGGSFVELRQVENVRTALRNVREAPLSAKERAWAAQDHEIWLMWNEMPAKDQGGGGLYEYQPEGGGGYMGRSIAATIEAMSEEAALVLRAAYGTPPSALGMAYGDGLGHVAAMTATVQSERVARAKRSAAARSLETAPHEEEARIFGQTLRSLVKGADTPLVRTREALESWDLRRIRAEDVLRDKLGDDVFRKRVADEAEAMLVKACAEYRKVRLRG